MIKHSLKLVYHSTKQGFQERMFLYGLKKTHNDLGTRAGPWHLAWVERCGRDWPDINALLLPGFPGRPQFPVFPEGKESPSD